MRPLTRGTTAATALAVLAPAAVLLSGAPATAAATTVDLVPLASFDSTSGRGEGGAEIVAFDPASRRVFITNDPVLGPDRPSVDVVDLRNPSSPVPLPSVNLMSQGASAVQSVAVSHGVLAVAVTLTSPQAPGAVLLYDAATSRFLRRAAVGALPDAVTFTPDGMSVVVANEGEAACQGRTLVNPEGSVSIVDVATGSVRTANLLAYNGRKAELQQAGVRLVLPGGTVAQELEPEYSTVSADGLTAYVTLQEANAVATVDLVTATVTAIRGAGSVDFDVVPVDASDRDGPGGTALINRRTRDVVGLVAPDGIASLHSRSGPVLLLAGEGDARDTLAACGVPSDTARLSSARVVLDPTAYPDGATIKADGTAAGYGRLNVSVVDGDTDGDGDIDQLTVLGSRSLRIVRPDGSLVFDTEDQLEALIAGRFPGSFNISSGLNDTTTFDARSDDKGPEPESVVVGRVGGRDLAFVALERVGGVATFEVTRPESTTLVGYDNPAIDGSSVGTSDRAPEGLVFVQAADSPNKQPLLLVSNEGLGTTTVYEVRLSRAAEQARERRAAAGPRAAGLASTAPSRPVL